MKILACQIDVPDSETTEEMHAHVRRVGQCIEKHCALNPDLDLIFLPELTTTPYSVDAFNKLERFAEDLHGFSFQFFSALAEKSGCGIVYGFPRRIADTYRISQCFVAAGDMPPAVYDKIHLAQLGDSMEKDYFSPGSDLCVFDCNGWRIAIVVCYDFRFSGLINTLCKRYDIDLFLHPVAFTRDATFASWHAFVIARALETQTYFLSLNRAGETWGHSIFCPPWVDAGTQPSRLQDKEEFSVISLCKDTLKKARATFPIKKDALHDYDQFRSNYKKL